MAAFMFKALLFGACVFALYSLIAISAQGLLHVRLPTVSLTPQWQGIERHL